MAGPRVRCRPSPRRGFTSALRRAPLSSTAGSTSARSAGAGRWGRPRSQPCRARALDGRGRLRSGRGRLPRPARCRPRRRRQSISSALRRSLAEVRRAIERAAAAPFAVLIEGESGSGKELVARALHRRSPRRDRPFCTLNCAALPDDLVEAELFGHARGAFTGAVAERPGVFEEAHTGTLFLDEIGELSPRAQAKVLRAIQEGELRRVGENVVAPRRRADRRRDQSRSAAGGRRRPLPARSAVSPRRHPHRRAAASRAARRHRGAGRALLARGDGARRQPRDARRRHASRRWRAMIGPATCASCRTCWRRSPSGAPRRGVVPPTALPPHVRGASRGLTAGGSTRRGGRSRNGSSAPRSCGPAAIAAARPTNSASRGRG